MYITKLLITILISSFTLQSAYSISSCNEAIEIKNELDEVVIELIEVEKKFSKSYMDDSIGPKLNMEIRSRLKTVDDQAEVEVLAETLDQQAADLRGEQYLNVSAIGASTGALILSRMLINKINASPRRLRIKAKLFRKVRTVGVNGRMKVNIVRGTIHLLSFWSIVGEVYFANQTYQNSKIRSLLVKMVEELNVMEEVLAESLLPKRKLAQELQVQLDELEEEGVIVVNNDKVICIN